MRGLIREKVSADRRKTVSAARNGHRFRAGSLPPRTQDQPATTRRKTGRCLLYR